MKNNKAQALIEFVLILPILILIIFSMIDFGRIITTKTSIENKLNDVILLKKTKTVDEIKTVINEETSNLIELSITNDSDYETIKLSTKINILTPGLNLILGNPYVISTQRVIAYEE